MKNMNIMPTYKITLIDLRSDERHEFDCPDDVYILDRAEELGIDLPYSCRAGSCSNCVAEIISGNVDQSGQNFLDQNEISIFALLCTAYPKSDSKLRIRAEERYVVYQKNKWENNKMLSHYYLFGNGRPVTLSEMGLAQEAYSLIFKKGFSGKKDSIHNRFLV